jgi:hypothetical protein
LSLAMKNRNHHALFQVNTAPDYLLQNFGGSTQALDKSTEFSCVFRVLHHL